jgi:hypothetical protein
MIPRSRSTAIACRTVVYATPYSSAKLRSLGSVAVISPAMRASGGSGISRSERLAVSWCRFAHLEESLFLPLVIPAQVASCGVSRALPVPLRLEGPGEPSLSYGPISWPAVTAGMGGPSMSDVLTIRGCPRGGRPAESGRARRVSPAAGLPSRWACRRWLAGGHPVCPAAGSMTYSC